MIDPMDLVAEPGYPPTGPEQTFRARLARMGARLVVELGTLQSEPPRSTHHAFWCPPDATHVKVDVQAGPDVDVVADAHHLDAVFAPGSVDAVIAVATWEHLARPWIAAEQVARILRPGGICYISTHHSFPVHGYPSDYTRWTGAGLTELFAAAGLTSLGASLYLPAKLIPLVQLTRWSPTAPVWLCVDYTGIKE